VREAIETKRWAEADSQSVVLGRALEAEALVLDSASAILESTGGRTP
jgi:hypothetical protein